MTSSTAMSIGVSCRKESVYAEDNESIFIIEETATSDAEIFRQRMTDLKPSRRQMLSLSVGIFT